MAEHATPGCCDFGVTVAAAEPSADPRTPAAAAVLDDLAVGFKFATATTTMICRGVTGGRSRSLFHDWNGFGGPHRQYYRDDNGCGCDIKNKNKSQSRPVFFFGRTMSISNRN